MKISVTAVVVAAFAIVGGMFSTSAPALAQTNTTDNTTPGTSMNTGGDMMAMMHEMSANHKWGMISSIQNDEQGRPAWIVAGHWMLDMGSQNDTATSDTTGRISDVSGFNAMLHMVRLNGSAMHNHEISNFAQVGEATFNGDTNSTTITGTATITLREGPVQNVRTTIEIAQDKVIAISPDPAAVENHFGDTPIYGIVISPEMIEQMMMGYGGMGSMMNSSSSGGM
jgi:hypothetical protein